jgi:hypothetical protein
MRKKDFLKKIEKVRKYQLYLKNDIDNFLVYKNKKFDKTKEYFN